jgi:hypothetical protein
MSALAAVCRERYARWQPVFWRPAVDAQDKHRASLSGLVARGEVIALVSEHAAGAALLRAALAEAARRGTVQAVVVTGRRDLPERRTLRSCGLDVASEWWITPLPPDPRQDPGRD